MGRYSRLPRRAKYWLDNQADKYTGSRGLFYCAGLFCVAGLVLLIISIYTFVYVDYERGHGWYKDTCHVIGNNDTINDCIYFEVIVSDGRKLCGIPSTLFRSFDFDHAQGCYDHNYSNTSDIVYWDALLTYEHYKIECHVPTYSAVSANQCVHAATHNTPISYFFRTWHTKFVILQMSDRDGLAAIKIETEVKYIWSLLGIIGMAILVLCAIVLVFWKYINDSVHKMQYRYYTRHDNAHKLS